MSNSVKVEDNNWRQNLLWPLGSSLFAVFWLVLLYFLEQLGVGVEVLDSEFLTVFMPLWAGIAVLLVGFIKSVGWWKIIPLLVAVFHLMVSYVVAALYYLTITW